MNGIPAVGKKLIILEGPDGAGKTTLAQELADKHREAGKRATIVHAGPPVEGVQEILPTMLYHALNQFAFYDVVIMDRSPLSELIYGSVLRKNVKGSDSEWKIWTDVQERRTNFDVQLFLLDAADETLLHRAYGVRGEEYVPPEKFMDIVNAYREFYRYLQEPKDWTRVMTDVDPDEE